MREEHEITVRIDTERTGFDLPLGGLFGAVPMDFFYDETARKFYFHCAKEGHKLDAIRACYASCYAEGLVRFVAEPGEGGFLSSAGLSGRDDMEVSAFGSDGRVILVARFDNLGKGASGAAIQNMNLVLGCDEATGLVKG